MLRGIAAIVYLTGENGNASSRNAEECSVAVEIADRCSYSCAGTLWSSRNCQEALETAERLILQNNYILAKYTAEGL